MEEYGFYSDTESAMLEQPAEPEPQEEPERYGAMANAQRTVQIFKTMGTHQKLRLLSEKALTEVLDWHLEEGVAYHFASFGDVDMLTYLRHIARDQRLEYVAIASWAIAQVDAEELDRWVARGIVGRIDYVVGDVFRTHLRYRSIKTTLERTTARCGGRVLTCRTHMKAIAIFGKEYDCVIESSANVETNPRAEQTCITVDAGLAQFYKEWFDNLPNFDETPEGWEPWSR